MTGEKSMRQHWEYTVTFAGGAVEHFVLPCPSIPVHLDRDKLLASLPLLKRQLFPDAGIEKIAASRYHVQRLFQFKNLADRFGPDWNEFFDALPKSDTDSRYPVLAQSAGLQSLVKNYLGRIQVCLNSLLVAVCRFEPSLCRLCIM